MTASDQDIQKAADAYVFGYPLVLVDLSRQVQTNTVTPTDHSAPVNQFSHHTQLAGPQDTGVVRVNRDTLYSVAWLDVAAEPVVLQVPGMGERYWLMQMMDAWSNTLQDPSSLAPGLGQPAEGPYTYAVTGPGWTGTLPAGVVALPMPTNTVWLAGRTEVDGPDDVDNVTALQDLMKLMPLSAWPGDGYTPPAGTVDPTVDMTTPPDVQVAAMAPADFYARLCTLLAAYPPSPDDPDTMHWIGTIGITPGGEVTLDDDALQQAVDAATDRITKHIDDGGKDLNGWTFSTAMGAYGTDYDQRAYVAKTALGANLPKDALYPSLGPVPADRYTLTFTDGLPPAGAFWSVTAYTVDGHFIDNPAQIYSVGHQIPVTGDPVTLVIQKDDPDLPDGYWLPIADDDFTLMMRLYAPTDPALDTWSPPPLNPLLGD
ncbi:DUF1254 domain-containing protein [Streptomyces laurentii]|uniref:DUF1254 domain-containing protein n=1 Tax=Streptomyces laurentii TaxID=39478 RepID=UPI0036955621